MIGTNEKKPSVTFDVNGEELTVFINGEIDHYGAVSVRGEIDKKIIELLPKSTVLVLSNIDFMDSSGIGLIIGRYSKMNGIGGTLKIRNASERVRKICKLAGLERIIEFEDRGDVK